jgi:hypothetical protein
MSPQSRDRGLMVMPPVRYLLLSPVAPQGFTADSEVPDSGMEWSGWGGTCEITCLDQPPTIIISRFRGDPQFSSKIVACASTILIPVFGATVANSSRRNLLHSLQPPYASRAYSGQLFLGIPDGGGCLPVNMTIR